MCLMDLTVILVMQAKKTQWEYDWCNVVMICGENKIKNEWLEWNLAIICK
jgi:hypothetical protein